MNFLQWRRFNFFEKQQLEAGSNQFVELVNSCQITCSSSENGLMLFGDNTGNVFVVNRRYMVQTFQAYSVAVTHCCTFTNRQNLRGQGNQKNANKTYLITIGTDSDDLYPILKIWQINEVLEKEFDTVDGNDESPQSLPLASCIRTIKLSTSPQMPTLAQHASVTVLNVLNDNHIVVGFNDGHCLVIKGEVRDRNLKMILLEVSKQQNSITGAWFATHSRSLANPSYSRSTTSARTHVNLFVSTRNETCSFDLSLKEPRDSKIVLDSIGSEIGCNCLKNDPKQLEPPQFVIGRPDAIYFYSTDGRGPCLAYKGIKKNLYWLRNYLVVITTNEQSIPQESSSSTILSNLCPNLITVYDITRKFIAFSSPIPAIQQVLSQWGNIFILTNDGSVIVLTELDTQTKLELLFKKNQFSLAIELAKDQTYSQDSLKEMFKQYGDHLYSSNDFDGAIQQYCQTIGLLEPSYVIRKFLDLQRIHNLTRYLQELHKRDVAIEDHTTLLINCYVKLKDEAKLNEFLKSSDITFDVDIAIRVLRQAGFYDNAVLLAKRHHRYDSFFSILLEDKGECEHVLATFQEFLNENKEDIVTQYLGKYGRALMNDEPERTTQLLKSLCSKMFRNSANNKTAKRANSTEVEAFDLSQFDQAINYDEYDKEFKPERFLHIFLNQPTRLIEYIEFVISESKAYNCEAIYVSFELSNTLLEMYLHSYKTELKDDGLAGNQSKIMSFLQNETDNYDPKKAMILCQMNNFIPGILFLYEKEAMFKQILAHFIARMENQKIIEVCDKFGDQDSSLWTDALCYFSENFNDSLTDNIIHVLNQIENNKLLPSLKVMEILSKDGKVTLGVVKDYLIRWISTERNQVEENEAMIAAYKEECEKITAQISEIRDKPRVFQASKCAACSHPLELPSIHFMCGHSFHQSCAESYAGEAECDCPICLPANRQILAEISQFDNIRNVNELFQQELSDSSDPFEVIARFASQGLFNPLTVVTDDGLKTAKKL